MTSRRALGAFTLVSALLGAALVQPLGAQDRSVLGVDVTLAQPEVLAPYFAALRAQQGPVRVLFVGDSAVVADGLSGEWRRVLQAREGDGGHGFMLAGKPWRWYVHRDVRQSGDGWDHTTILAPGRDHRFGLGFVRAETRGAATATWGTARDGTIGTRMSRFELWYGTQPGGGSLRVELDGTPALTISSAGARAPHYEALTMPDGPHEVSVRAQADGPVLVYGAVLERERGVVVDAIGVNGAQARHFLFADEALLDAHVAHREPALLVVQLGTNLANGTRAGEYGAHLRTLVRRLRHGRPGLACLLLAPPDRAMARNSGGEGTPAYIPEITAQTLEVAQDTGCASFDTFAAMGGFDSFLRWRARGLGSSDGSHFSRAGYARLAELLDHAVLAARGAP